MYNSEEKLPSSLRLARSHLSTNHALGTHFLQGSVKYSEVSDLSGGLSWRELRFRVLKRNTQCRKALELWEGGASAGITTGMQRMEMLVIMGWFVWRRC